MNKEYFLIFTKIFWMAIAVIFLVYLHKVNKKLDYIENISYAINGISTFDGDISNYSRKIKSDNPFVPDRYEKIPLEIRIVK